MNLCEGLTSDLMKGRWMEQKGNKINIDSVNKINLLKDINLTCD